MHEKTPESDEEKSFFEALKGIILTAPTEIEREFDKGGNSWFACVNTQLQAMLSFLEFATQSQELDESSAQEAMSKFVALGIRVKELIKQYPQSDEIVPEDIKSEILSHIDILK